MLVEERVTSIKSADTAPHRLNDERTSLKDKRIAITGGTTGIGRATAKLLAADGARIFVVGRDKEALEEARRVDPERIDGMTADLAEQEGIEAFFEQAIATMGGLDIAISSTGLPGGGLSDMSAKDIRYMLDVNFTASVMCARAAFERMGEGHIVIIGSTSAHDLTPGSTVYAGAKAGIAGFAKALRRELGPKGIRVTLVEPGLTGTDLHFPGKDSPEHKQWIAEEKMLMAEDIAAAIHFALTQPNRAVVQQISVVPRNNSE
jgi:3-oxoacyl-[acyl-carrier protein] reductase